MMAAVSKAPAAKAGSSPITSRRPAVENMSVRWRDAFHCMLNSAMVNATSASTSHDGQPAIEAWLTHGNRGSDERGCAHRTQTPSGDSSECCATGGHFSSLRPWARPRAWPP